MNRTNKLSLACCCGFVAILVITFTAIPFVKAQAESSTDKLVDAVRLINTQEYSYQHDNGRFADRDEMLSYLHKKDLSKQSPIDLENKESYELTIIASSDGKHYQIALKPTYDKSHKSTLCSRAAFSDDAGVIFLGSALDCEGSSPQ
jgi:hypothetical protein